MKDRLGDLWGSWTGDVPGAVVAALFVVATVLWIGSSGLAGRAAAQRNRPVYPWAALVTIGGALVLAGGLLWPGSFHRWVLVAGCASLGLAFIARSQLQRTSTLCPAGHDLSPSWVHCPFCPAPKRERAPAHAGAGTIAAARSATPAPPPPPARPAPVGPVLVRLIVEGGRASDATVHADGALIGRSPDADVVVDDPAASWEHARVLDRHGSASVVDLGSSNGTYVNEERVETSMLIGGDRLRVGDTVFRVVT